MGLIKIEADLVSRIDPLRSPNRIEMDWPIRFDLCRSSSSCVVWITKATKNRNQNAFTVSLLNFQEMHLQSFNLSMTFYDKFCSPYPNVDFLLGRAPCQAKQCKLRKLSNRMGYTYLCTYVYSKHTEMQTRLNESQPCTSFARTRLISSTGFSISKNLAPMDICSKG